MSARSSLHCIGHCRVENLILTSARKINMINSMLSSRSVVCLWKVWLLTCWDLVMAVFLYLNSSLSAAIWFKDMGKGVQPKPGLLPGRLVAQHLRSCQAKHGRCGLCFWGQKKKTWEAKLSSRWLFVTLKNKMARLGCSVCAQASTGGPWANFDQKPLSVKLVHLKRHERSKTHVAALAATRSSDHAALAPDDSVFQEAFLSGACERKPFQAWRGHS